MKDRLARGAIWIAASRLCVNGIGFVSTIVLARLLMPQDFGLVAVATTVMAIVASVTEIQLSSALMQHAEPDDAHYDTAFTLNLIRAAGVAGLTAALAWPVAAIYGDSRLVALIVALAVVSGVLGLSNPRMVEFSRALVFRQDFALNVSQKLLGFLAALAVAWVYRSYWALVVGAAVSQGVAVAMSYALVRYRPRLSLAKARELMSFSIWVSFSQIVATLNFRFDNLFIGYLLGKTTLGYYSYADNLAGLATREVVAPVANTLFPAYAHLQHDPGRLRAAHGRTQSLLFAIALPAGCGFALVAQPLVHLALGDKWTPVAFVIEVIAAVFAVQSIGNTCFPLAMGMGQTRRLFHRDLANFSFRLPILGLGLVLGGFTGVVLSRIVTGVLSLWLNLSLIRSLIGVRIRDQLAANLRPVIGVALMAAAVLLVRGAQPPPLGWRAELLALAVQVAAGGVAYLGAVYVAWRMAGRPDGVERDAAAAFEALARFTTAKAAR